MSDISYVEHSHIRELPCGYTNIGDIVVCIDRCRRISDTALLVKFRRDIFELVGEERFDCYHLSEFTINLFDFLGCLFIYVMVFLDDDRLEFLTLCIQCMDITMSYPI